MLKGDISLTTFSQCRTTFSASCKSCRICNRVIFFSSFENRTPSWVAFGVNSLSGVPWGAIVTLQFPFNSSLVVLSDSVLWNIIKSEMTYSNKHIKNKYFLILHDSLFWWKCSKGKLPPIKKKKKKNCTFSYILSKILLQPATESVQKKSYIFWS